MHHTSCMSRPKAYLRYVGNYMRMWSIEETSIDV